MSERARAAACSRCGGVARCGAAWHGMVRCTVAQCVAVRHSAVRCGTVECAACVSPGDGGNLAFAPWAVPFGAGVVVGPVCGSSGPTRGQANTKEPRELDGRCLFGVQKPRVQNAGALQRLRPWVCLGARECHKSTAKTVAGGWEFKF